MKKVMALFLVSIIIILQMSTVVFAGEARKNFSIEYDGKVVSYTSKIVTLNIDGKDVQTGEMPAIIIDNRTLVPAREVFESDSFSAKVDWNQSRQEVYITYKDQSIVLKIGSEIAFVNNEPITLDVPAELIRDTSQKYPKTMIPLRFVTESLGYGIEWNQSSYTAKITSPNSTSPSPTATPTATPTVTATPTPTVAPTTTPTPNIEGDQFSELISSGAKRKLPTELKDDPIVWQASTIPDNNDAMNSVITAQNNPETSILSVKYDDSSRTFKITASSPISSVEKSMWSGKYIIDIIGAKYGFDSDLSYKMTYADNPITKEVRSSQQEDRGGTKVLRVVFDLINPDATYDLSISQDRKILTLKMKETILHKVELGQNDIGDFILLTGSSAPDVNAFRLSNPSRIVFDLKNMTTLLGHQSEEDVLGQYVTSIRTSPFDSTTTRVVVETDGQAHYEITKVDNKTTKIQLMEPSYKNIRYENYETPTITLENIASKVRLDDITYKDNYMDKEYTIDLPGDYADIFGSGDIHIDDDVISNIEIIKNNNGNTSLVIHEKGIYVFRLEADEKNVYIKAYKPKQIYSQIIVVDFGHGGTDPGAINGSYREKDLNLAIGKFLKGYLDNDSSIKVYYTRLDDSTVELKTRTPFANDVDADFLISIHNNSALSSSANGTETLYFKDTDVPGLNSIELAKIVHNNVVQAVGLKDRGVRDDNGLFILRTSSMPSIIVEVGFVSNATDVVKLADPAVQQKVAKAIYESIVQVFQQYPSGR